jgi:MFS family permease
MAIFGIGAGLAFPSLMTVAMSGVEMSEAGLASGLVNTAAQVGGAIGLAVLATVSASRSDDLIAAGTAEAAALTDGYHFAFWIGVALVAAAIAVAFTVIRHEPMPEGGFAELEGDEGASAPEAAYSEAA